MNQNVWNESELRREKIDIIILMHLGIQSREYTRVHLHCTLQLL